MVELLFLPSVYTECPDCHGTRYQSSTLEIMWRGRNIAEILAMSVEEAHDSSTASSTSCGRSRHWSTSASDISVSDSLPPSCPEVRRSG